MSKKKETGKFDSAVTVSVKRHKETCFIVCDEYETVTTLKGRYLGFLNSIGFRPDKADDEYDFNTDAIRLNLRKRVSATDNLIS